MLVSNRYLAATTAVTARVVESESVESHVFSWSRSRFFKTAGVGVRSRSRVFKNPGVGVGFLKLLESELGVGVGFSKLLESESGVRVGILKNLLTPQPCL